MADDGTDPTRSVAAQWFSSDQGEAAEGPMGWRLDVVTLLAVIGESSIAEHSQTITASIFCLFPRIIPAPQAFLKPSRPARLPEVTARMTGVYSGVTLDTVGFFANIIHPLDELPPFSFKVLQITHTDRNNAGGIEVPRTPNNNKKGLWVGRTGSSHELSNLSPGRLPPTPDNRSDTPNTAFSSSNDVEAGEPKVGIVRRMTVKEKIQDFTANPTLVNNNARPAIPATLYSPLHILSVFSILLTCGIIGLAARYQDGTAIIAVTLISFASSVVGWASWWKPLLMNRRHTNIVPAGDVIIRTREGAFLLVKCTEEVARELYSGTEECQYHVGGRAYRALMGLGTCLLMISVILLGNCKWYTQIFIGGSYIVLNGIYWAMGLLPKRYFWDLSRYHVEDITSKEAQNAHLTTDPDDLREGVKSFTRTLWYAVRETKRTAWVNRSGAAPDTPQWRKWLAEAEQAANAGNKKWPAVARKDEIMKMRDGEVNGSLDGPQPIPERQFDAAEQAVPATEVQHDRRPAQSTNF